LAILAKSAARPFVTSLTQDFENSTANSGGYLAASDKPLVCFHPCDARNPHSAAELCNAVKSLRIVYGWEISVPDEFGVYSSYVKLIDSSSVFGATNDSVLETVYFRHRFRVRCSAQMVVGEAGNRLPVLKSNTVEVQRESRSGRASECRAKWKEREESLMGQKSIVAMQSLERVGLVSVFFVV